MPSQYLSSQPPAIRACKVRDIARGDDAVSRALFDELRHDQARWTLVEWQAVLAALDSSTLTLGDWIASRADWI